MRRVGVLGGTFDPIHHGHLAAAEECRVRLRLTEVLFVPAGQPPHKHGRSVASAALRAAMVDLAIATNPFFRLSRIEVDRSGPSYSVETVAQLKDELRPATEIYFIIGMDSLAEILAWHEPARLLSLCHVVAVTRPGVRLVDLASLEPDLPGAGQRISLLPVPELNISSSNLRRRVFEGLPIKYQLPESVEAFIAQHQLYRPSGSTPSSRQ
ncbi:MAG: nicotinate-nucleotide adenylyltransferase [Chloroflexi bacterium]|nr:nicotinate-nucleotide adenylyltransferase [Chloroflexota bacterium]